MSRTRSKHPHRVCRVGRRRCRACQRFGFGLRAKRKRLRRDAGRSDALSQAWIERPSYESPRA